MQGRRAALKWAGAATACLLAFTACSGGAAEPTDLPDKPDKKNTASKTPEGTPTPTPPSPSPVSSDKHESWTFVRHYEALTGYAFLTGDAAPLEELSAPGCKSCQFTVDLINEVYDAGGHFEGDYKGHVEEVSGSNTAVNVYIKFGEGRKIAKAGAQAEVYEPESRNKTYQLEREGSQWIVSEIDNQPAK